MRQKNKTPNRLRVSTTTVFLAIFLVLLVANVVFVVPFAREKIMASFKMGNAGNDATTNILPTNNTPADLPVPITNPMVTNVYYAYNFFGKVKEVKTNSEETVLALDTADTTIPLFILETNGTQILQVKNGQVAPAAITDLKPGSAVSVSSTYDVKLRLWQTRAVHLVLDEIPTLQ